MTEGHISISYQKSLAGVHDLRHACATHLPASGVDIHIIQTLPGHASIRTNRNYTRVTRARLQTIQSPIEEMALEWRDAGLSQKALPLTFP